MVAANGHLVFPGGGAGDADGDGVGLAAAAGEAHHVGPGIELHQPLGQFHFLGAVERGHIALADGFHHGGVHFVVGVAQHVGADAHDRQVEKFVAIQVPDGASLGFGIVGRPILGQEHLGPLGEQHGAAGDEGLGFFV